MYKKLVKLLVALSAVLALTLFTNVEAKADTADDAAAALAYQQAIDAQNALAYQQALAAQAAAYQKALDEYNKVLLAQYNQALAAQLQAAQLVNHYFAQTQQDAFNQAFLLNSVKTMQNAQYQSMVNYNNLEYSGYLKDEYQKFQNNGLSTFVSYEGLVH